MGRSLPAHVQAAVDKARAGVVATSAPAEIRLRLPSPPSANRYWRSDRGRLPHVSDEARAFKSRVKDAAFAQGSRSPMKCLVHVELTWTRPARRGDLDNIVKVALDSLRGIAFVDDSQVVDIRARRQDRDAGEPGLDVIVRPAA